MPLDADFKHRKVQIDYQGSRDSAPRPRQITLLDTRISSDPEKPPIVEARCAEAGALRHFRIDRIHEALDAETGEVYGDGEALLRAVAPEDWGDWTVLLERAALGGGFQEGEDLERAVGPPGAAKPEQDRTLTELRRAMRAASKGGGIQLSRTEAYRLEQNNGLIWSGTFLLGLLVGSAFL